MSCSVTCFHPCFQSKASDIDVSSENTEPTNRPQCEQLVPKKDAVFVVWTHFKLKEDDTE